METTQPAPQIPGPNPHPFNALIPLPQTRPWVTYLLFGVSIAVFVCYKIPAQPLGAPGSGVEEIWAHDQYWHIITDAFIHLEPLHLAFNIYWFYLLGSLVERQMGWFRFILFILASDLVSSSFQLATGNSGIGLSGVVYALVGYMLLTRRRYLEIAQLMHDGNAIVLVGWLFLCIALTWLNILNIGNAAHFSGIIFGIAVGAAVVLHPKSKRILWAAVASAMLALSFIPPVWAPWTDNFLLFKAYAAQQKGDLNIALAYYDQILTRTPNNNLARFLRGHIYIEQGDRTKGQAEIDSAVKMDPTLIKLQSTSDEKEPN